MYVAVPVSLASFGGKLEWIELHHRHEGAVWGFAHYLALHIEACLYSRHSLRVPVGLAGRPQQIFAQTGPRTCPHFSSFWNSLLNDSVKQWTLARGLLNVGKAKKSAAGR